MLPPAKKTKQQKKKQVSFHFFLSFLHQVVVTSAVTRFKVPPFHQPDLYHSPRPTISFCTRPTTTTCSAATFRMTTEGVVLERFKKRTNLASFASKRKEILSSWCCF
jgi:hypothetical protein